MENRAEHLERIDFVLNYLKQNKDEKEGWVQKKYLEKYPKKENEFKAIIEKLIEDKLINLDSSTSICNVRFEGYIFEGYAKSMQNKIKENNRSVKLSVLCALGGALLGGLLGLAPTILQEINPHITKISLVDAPKILIVRDTCFVQNQKTHSRNPK